MTHTRMNKTRWIELFQAIGLDEGAMKHWHREFESRYPAEHQDFLEWLGVSAEEIVRIRAL